MRILMITPNFPPMSNPISFTSWKLAQALAGQGAELTIVAKSFESGKSKTDDSSFWDKTPGEITRLSAPWYARPERAANYAAKIRMRERTTSWFGAAAYKYCRRLLKKKSFDLILSRSNPVDGMLAGCHLRQQFNIKWAAGINDPFPLFLYPEPYAAGQANGFMEELQLKWTRKALSFADYVIFPCRRLGTYMAGKLDPGLENKMVVAHHVGWSKESKRENNGRINLLHVGSLGLPRVTTKMLTYFHETLKGFPELARKLKITFLGHVDESFKRFAADNGMAGFIRFEDTVPYEESLNRMSRADALLIMEAPFKEGIFFPSKFSDYAMSRKPLLIFSPDNGTLSDFVGGYGHPGFLGQEEGKYKEGINRLLERLDGNESLADYAYAHPENFEPAKVARDLVAAL